MRQSDDHDIQKYVEYLEREGSGALPCSTKKHFTVMKYKTSKRRKHGVSFHVILCSPFGDSWERGDCGDYTNKEDVM